MPVDTNNLYRALPMPMPRFGPSPTTPTNPVVNESPYPDPRQLFAPYLGIGSNTGFSDVTASLQTPITNPYGSGENIDPVTQRILDLIDKRTAEAGTKAGSEASALASRRGLPGSSIEQFGVQQGIEGANRVGNEATTAVLQQFLTNRKDAELATMDAELRRRLALGQLTSDEVASLRNQFAYQQGLELQKQLGEAGIALGRENIGAQQDIAQKEARNSLIGAGISTLPYLLGGGGGGGGGLFGGGGGGGGGLLSGFGGGSILSNMFGGSATPVGQFLMPGVSGAGPEGIPLANAGQNPFQAGGPGGLAAGIGLGYAGGALGRNQFGGGNDVGGYVGGALGYSLGGPVGAGVGSFLGTGIQRGGEAIYRGVNKKLGNTAGSIVRPFVDPVGSAKSVVNKVSNAVSSVFPF